MCRQNDRDTRSSKKPIKDRTKKTLDVINSFAFQISAAIKANTALYQDVLT
jgi:hypothetical protein